MRFIWPTLLMLSLVIANILFPDTKTILVELISPNQKTILTVLDLVVRIGLGMTIIGIVILVLFTIIAKLLISDYKNDPIRYSVILFCSYIIEIGLYCTIIPIWLGHLLDPAFSKKWLSIIFQMDKIGYFLLVVGSLFVINLFISPKKKEI